MLLKHPRYIFPIYKTNIFNTVQNDKKFYLILVNSMQTKVGKDFPDKAMNSTHGYPRYGLVYINNNVAHEQKYFKLLIEALNKKDIKTLLNDFLVEEQERKEKKRDNVRKAQRKFRKKSISIFPSVKKVGKMHL